MLNVYSYVNESLIPFTKHSNLEDEIKWFLKIDYNIHCYIGRTQRSSVQIGNTIGIRSNIEDIIIKIRAY